ncbi:MULTISPECIES: Zn-ribbon domain-containing OB-fold protein [unclassified Nocardioides]|uniref:Zn-ribbon domain-containing OB-fold protein n=1 Tax=unclassified Nocardioides TaxID=2615069 RepID=UPI000ABA9BA2|nr:MULTISPECIES: Zn-ribbon domain-containing OB-fold protein [unclassified Nocardioides]
MSIPEPDEMTQVYWDATRERRLLLQHCDACGHTQHPPRTLCTYCGETDALSHREAAGTGVVDACTVVMRSPSPDHEAPYVVARVRLPEGVVLISNVETDEPHAIAIGDAVRLAWRPLDDGRALPVFHPDHQEN